MGKPVQLAKEQRRALDRLTAVRGIERFYLAGGTAVAIPKAGRIPIPVAGLRDLAAMKLAAIARRGLKRDFWDLHAISESGLTLREMADAYLSKFGTSQADLYHVLRSLTYFDDAERETGYPRGLTHAKWERIKAFFRREAPALLSE